MKRFSLLMTIIITGLLGFWNASLAQQHDHQKQKQQTKAVQSQEQTKEVYSCPMHPDVVSDKPGNCSKCGMKLEKREQPFEGPIKKMSGMMGSPTFEQSIEGYRVQVWLITQEEHKNKMQGHKDDSSDAGMMKHGMMGKEQSHDMKKMDHGMMGKGMMQHDKKEDQSKMMEAMFVGTHHIMVVVTDEKTNKPVEGAKVKTAWKSPSEKLEAVELVEMMEHFGGGVTLGEKGQYAITVEFNVANKTHKTHFTFQQ